MSSRMDESERRQQIAVQLSAIMGEVVRLDISLSDSRDNALLDVGTMSYDQRRDGGDKHRSFTLMAYEAQGFDLPEFTVKPRNAGRALAERLVGSNAISFDGVPEFSQAYDVHGVLSSTLQILFGREVRKTLSQKPGWSIYAKGKRLFLFQFGKRFDDNELPNFIEEAIELVGVLRAAEVELDGAPGLQRVATTQDEVDSAREMGGLAGLSIRNELKRIAVSPAELERFLEAPIPRQIPKGLAQQVLGDNAALLVLGPFFAVFGIVFGVLFWFLGPEDFRLLSVFLPFPPVFIGAALFGFTFRHRKRKTRLLESGELVDGRILKLDSTDLSINDQRRFVATVEFEYQGGSRNGSSNLYGPAVDKAQQLQESGQSVRLLIDPQDATHLVVLDTLAVFE